jgi:hypothetical protein
MEVACMGKNSFFEIERIEGSGDTWIAYLKEKSKRRSHWRRNFNAA